MNKKLSELSRRSYFKRQKKLIKSHFAINDKNLKIQQPEFNNYQPDLESFSDSNSNHQNFTSSSHFNHNYQLDTLTLSELNEPINEIDYFSSTELDEPINEIDYFLSTESNESVNELNLTLQDQSNSEDYLILRNYYNFI